MGLVVIDSRSGTLVFFSACTKMNHLKDIQRAGQAMAQEQYPLYLEKQAALQEQYKVILSPEVEEKQEEEEVRDDWSKQNDWSKEKARLQQRDKRNAKHVRSMTRAERQQEIDHLMKRLYYGLDELAVPADFQHLVTTSNPSMNHINQYNIMLACQTVLKQIYPNVFSY
tara:strand:- start:844 stop:1350 length:507 start_codon:yes stop_codon:yes gene_type:complete